MHPLIFFCMCLWSCLCQTHSYHKNLLNCLSPVRLSPRVGRKIIPSAASMMFYVLIWEHPSLGMHLYDCVNFCVHLEKCAWCHRVPMLDHIVMKLTCKILEEKKKKFLLLPKLCELPYFHLSHMKQTVLLEHKFLVLDTVDNSDQCNRKFKLKQSTSILGSPFKKKCQMKITKPIIGSSGDFFTTPIH